MTMATNEEKLVKMLKYVSEHNDFYKNRIKEYGITNPLDITQWPVLTRKELQENRYNMFSDGYKSKYFNQQLRRQSSSGSSGMPVNVYWDYKDWYASNMSLWRKRCQWYGIKPSDRYVIFTLNTFDIKADCETVYYVKEPENVLSVNVSLVQNEKQYKKLVDIINDFNPTWLYVQPFILNKLVQIYKKYEIKKPPALRYIESVGEILASDLRRRAIEFFDVSFANMYGSEEMNGIAYEDPEHHMFVLEDNALVEVFHEGIIMQRGKGEAIITNLYNYAIPLIRYNQNDIIEIYKRKSFENKIISCIEGRKMQEVIINRYCINAFAFSEIISSVNNQLDDVILNFQFVYIKSANNLMCKLVIDYNRIGWVQRIKEVLIKNFELKTNIKMSESNIISVSNIEKNGLKPKAIVIVE